MPQFSTPELQSALSLATDTKLLSIGRGVLRDTPRMFTSAFGNAPAVVVADETTFAAAGRSVVDALRGAGIPCFEPFIFEDPNLSAEHGWVDHLQQSLASHDAVPVAVGAGTINDLTKLAAHRATRSYLIVATAASMDGYTAFGASITLDGAKQTIECPAPRAVIADLDVIAAAPIEMNAWGYADLLAKVTAGADWILADVLGVESIHRQAWQLVQDNLRGWLSDPAGIRRGDVDSIRNLTIGLLMSGFAIQAARSSRAASGAEHQFSHLWDMQHHTHHGAAPSHGAKVGVATAAVARFYQRLLDRPIEAIDIPAICDRWPDITAREREIDSLFAPWPTLIEGAKRETRAKHVSRDQLRGQMRQLITCWPRLSDRVRRQLLPAAEIEEMLASAGAPSRPAQIGISRDRLIGSFRLACQIRRRFTVLDLADRLNLLEEIGGEI